MRKKKIKKFSDWIGVLKKTGPGDGKPTYISIWPHRNYMYYTECIELIDIKNLPCITTCLQCLSLSKIVIFRTCLSVDLI